MSSSVVRSCSSFAVFFAFFRFLGFAMITSVEPNQTYVRKYENLYKTKPVSLIDLVHRFGSEEICRDYLLAIRWPDGAICPRCQSESVSEITTRYQFDCNACRFRFSITSGTIFDNRSCRSGN